MTAPALPEQHTPWIPHVTLVYTDDADLEMFVEKTGSVTFDKIRVVFGGDVYDIPLDGSNVNELTAAFDPDQPRDPNTGEWVDSAVDALHGEDAFNAPTMSAYSDLPDEGLSGVSAEKIYGALSDYMANDYADINGSLQGGKGKTSVGFTRERKAQVRAIDAIMKHSTLRDSVVVHRGIRRAEQVFGTAWSDESMVGTVWQDYGYISTSTDHNIAKRFTTEVSPTMLRIHVPSGTHAVGLERDEFEILLNRGLTFKIVGDHRDGDVRTLDVEVVS